jgi:Dos2-interacting transcription regulator of RNA-Pol-II
MRFGEIEPSIQYVKPLEGIQRLTVYFKARVLVTYYCEKLDDTETIIPALRGILVLARLPSCPSNDATTILRAYVSNAQ